MEILAAKEEISEKVKSLFYGWNETIITSSLQGVMGHVYVAGDAAAAYLGDFAFYAGTPSEELLRFKPNPESKFVIMVPRGEVWEPLLEKIYGNKAKKATRYAIRKDTVFDRAHLEKIKSRLPEGCTIEPLGEDVYSYCKENEWCRDWVSQFDSYDDFRRRGLGMIVKKDGIPISGASSYFICQGGIEIQVDTHRDYRRRGLAAVVSAGLILECLNQGIYPSWDAANLGSVALAEKLGYTFDHEYTAYEVNW